MKKWLFNLLLATLIIFTSAWRCSAENILTNPGFEKGEFPPQGWDDWSGSDSDDPKNGVAGFPTPLDSAHSGAKGMGKILYGSGVRWGGFSQTVSASGGRNFTASGWVMSKRGDVAIGNGAYAFIEVKFIDDTETELRKVKSESIRTPTNWKKMQISGIVPAGATKAIFSFVLIGPKKSRGKVFFDDAYLSMR